MNTYAYYAIKLLISALLVVAISEVAKRSATLGALIASIPFVSILAFVWLYLESGNADKIPALSLNIFWLVIPSLLLFLSLPSLLKLGWSFWPSLLGSMALTSVAYVLMLRLLQRFGVEL